MIAEDEMLDDPRLVMLDIREPEVSVTEFLVCRRETRVTTICRAAFDELHWR